MSQAELIKAMQDKISSNIRVAMPGLIETYEFKTCKASIKIDMQELYQNDTVVDYPVIANVPVIHLRSGGAEISMPVKRGDSCLVIFMDRDIKAWLLGASKQPPKSRRLHHLNDAVAIMGLSPFSKPSSAMNNTDLMISYDGSRVTLKPKGIIEIESAKELDIKTENIVINCKNATIKATDKINTETPAFIQKGNLKIDGNIEVTGSSLIKGKLNTEAGIENSGSNLVSNGKTFESHTHDYENVASVMSPQGACTVTKVLKNTGKTN